MSARSVPVELEYALLQIVGDHEKPSWRLITSLLSNLNVPRDPDMMDALIKMRDDGLLTRMIFPGTASDSWSLTTMGRSRLDFLRGTRT